MSRHHTSLGEIPKLSQKVELPRRIGGCLSCSRICITGGLPNLTVPYVRAVRFRLPISKAEAGVPATYVQSLAPAACINRRLRAPKLPSAEASGASLAPSAALRKSPKMPQLLGTGCSNKDGRMDNASVRRGGLEVVSRSADVLRVCNLAFRVSSSRSISKLAKCTCPSSICASLQHSLHSRFWLLYRQHFHRLQARNLSVLVSGAAAASTRHC